MIKRILLFFLVIIISSNIIYSQNVKERFIGNFVYDDLGIIENAKVLDKELKDFYEERRIKIILYISQEKINDKEVWNKYNLEKSDNLNILIVYDKVNGLRDHISECASEYSYLFDKKKREIDVFGALQGSNKDYGVLSKLVKEYEKLIIEEKISCKKGFDLFRFINEQPYLSGKMYTVSEEKFRGWYFQSLVDKGFAPSRKSLGDMTEEESRIYLDNYRDYILAHKSDKVFIVWRNRKYITQAAELYNVDPYFLAATIVLEQIDFDPTGPSESLRNKVILINPKLAEFVPENVLLSEWWTDLLGGIFTGKTSVGLGQIAIQNIDRYNLQDMASKSNLEKTLFLLQEKNNIYALAELTEKHAIELKQKNLLVYSKGWRDKEFVEMMGSRQTTSGFWFTIWGDRIYKIAYVLNGVNLLYKEFS